MRKIICCLIYLLMVVQADAGLRLRGGGSGGGGGGGSGALPSGFSTLKIGGGGFVTGLDINGSMLLARTDTAGAYIASGGVWNQLITTTTMPAGTGVYYSNSGQVGVYGIASAPTNPNRIYMMRNGIIYTSSNGGASFTVCAGSAGVGAAGNANDPYRYINPKLTIDPANEAVVLVGTQNVGAYYSTNTCATFTKVPAPVTTSDAGGYIFAFDPSGGTSASPTRTNNVYVGSVTAHSVFKSTASVSSGSWASTSVVVGADFQQMATANGGIILLATNEPSKLYRYNRASSGAWDTITHSQGGNGIQGIAVNPTNTRNVTIVNVAGSQVSYTSDITIATPTWTDVFPVATPQTDVPWLGYTANTFMSIANALYDATGTNVYVGAGIGVFKLNPLTQTTWISQTAGIENLTTNAVISPSFTTAAPVFAIWDRILMRVDITNFPNYPSQNQPNSGFNASWSVDWSHTGNTIVALAGEFGSPSTGASDSGYSTDGGITYTSFPTNPAGSSLYGGSITASTASNFVWVSNAATTIYYTTNTGTSWTASTIASNPSNTGWSNAVSHQIEADRNTSGKFWAYNNLNGKIYTSTDNGANFAAVVSQNPANLTTSLLTNGFGADLRSVPGFSNHLYAATGGRFIRTTDGVNWASLSNCSNGLYYGFGKIATGRTYPTIFALNCDGTGTNDIWKSVDGDQATPTFTKIGTAPWPDQIIGLAGDWNIEGQFYFIYTGSSAGGYHP